LAEDIVKSGRSFVAVFMTAPDAKTGAAIGTAAVEAGLAACANVVLGLRSIYRWKGKVLNDPEVLVIFKTRRAALARLERLVRKHHPYEVFELVALPIIAGYGPYLDWIVENTV
jgi:periplasmic divalent cation tolerance protein